MAGGASAARRVVRGAAAAALMALAAADCWDDNKCIFHQYKDGTNEILYSWDLRSLCNNGNGYTATNATLNPNLLYKFEICGSIDAKGVPAAGSCTNPNGCVQPGAQTFTYCNPEYNAYPYEGNFMQFFDPAPATQCAYGRNDGTLGSGGGCPNTGTSGMQNNGYCCTGQCEVLAYGNAAYNYRWINNNDVQFGGIRWTAYGDNPDNGDEFACPTDPNTGYPRARIVYVNMYCNKNGTRADPIVVNQWYDSGDCIYRISLTHFAACGVEGDPFDTGNCTNSTGGGGGANAQVSSSPGLPVVDTGFSIGFVLLGAVLGLGASYVYGRLRECGGIRLPKVRLPTISVTVSYGATAGDATEAPAALLGDAYRTAQNRR